MPKIIELTKYKDSLYKVLIDNELYILDEEVILKYKLLKNKEIDEDLINEAINYNKFIEYYNKALNYQLRYSKTKNELILYLKNKEIDDYSISLIIDMLIERKIINDEKLIKLRIESLIKKQYGIKMIEYKLKNNLFSHELIKLELDNLNYELYYEELNKLYLKNKDKYNKYDEFTSKMKLKNYLFQRGYTSSDISILDF